MKNPESASLSGETELQPRGQEQGRDAHSQHCRSARARGAGRAAHTEEVTGTQIRRDVKLPLPADDTILYVENYKPHPKTTRTDKQIW